AYDPAAGSNVRGRYAGNDRVRIVDNPYQALDKAAGLIIATEWPEFKEGDLKKIAAALEQPLVFDGRNIFKPATMKKAGFTYYSIGRRPVLPTS
ncbi:MAG: UDP binding domain-containing protein, partial [Candidatus Saccharimonadales bacterium]